jgi:hypothetical protein
MNTVYESTLIDESLLSTIESKEEDAVRPLGTFGGTIYKVLYRSNGSFVPSDTSDQLIFDGVR